MLQIVKSPIFLFAGKSRSSYFADRTYERKYKEDAEFHQSGHLR